MTTHSEESDPRSALTVGTISYPFQGETQPLGINSQEDKFVIRTVSGKSEYIVEIPRAATDYNVMVPLAIKSKLNADEFDIEDFKNKNPQMTDRELLESMGDVDGKTAQDRTLLDRAFGVGEEDGPSQAPSYSLGLARIQKLYRRQEYQLTLIEINSLLQYYPRSSRLYKMKGSIFVKLGNLELAEKSWQRAVELTPEDQLVRKGLTRLRKRIEASKAVVLDKAPEVEQKPQPSAN